MIQLATGSQVLKIDNQGRIKLPVAQVEFFKGQGDLMITQDPQTQCLIVISKSLWSEKAAKLLQLTSVYHQFNTLKRRFVGNARDCEIDNHSRLAIPKIMRDIIGVRESCVFVAQGNKFEIFSEEKWLEVSQEEINLGDIPVEELAKYESNLNI